MTGHVAAAKRRHESQQEAQSTDVTAEVTRTWQRGWRGPGWVPGSCLEAEHFTTSSGERRPQDMHYRRSGAGWLHSGLHPPKPPSLPHIVSTPDRVMGWCNELTVTWSSSGL